MTSTEHSGVPVGRLAPSPTGVLHVGNARTFLLAWLMVRSHRGILRMRIEDIDGPRIKPRAGLETLELLAWLGLDWDLEVWWQTRRTGAYAASVARLIAAGLAYPCVCSRKEVLEAASAPHETEFDARPYPGTCRGRFGSVAEAEAATGKPAALRFRVDVAARPFHDGFRGPEPGRVAGDFVIQKRDGGHAYQLAVVVDDAAMGVTEVLRGEDLLHSTPRQILLYEALGLPLPHFLHVPLVVGGDGRKLSKRHGESTLAGLRAAGWSASRIVGMLAHLCGLAPPGVELAPKDLIPSFRLETVPRGPVVLRTST